MMNGSVVNEMTAENTLKTCSSGPANCTHVNVKKARTIGRVCALCHTRVFKFWKTRKCVDCKAVFHKTCVIATEKETAEQKVTTDPVAIAELETPTSVEATPTAEVTSEQRPRGDEVVPLYVTPASWPWADPTTITVQDRCGRTAPLTVVMAHGHLLSAAFFRGLFDTLPVRRRRAPVAGTSAPSSAWELVLATPTPRPRRRRRPTEWSDAGPREAGDARRTKRDTGL